MEVEKRVAAIVCGGRDYTNKTFLFAELDRLREEHGITEIAQGAARGADECAARWANARRVPCQSFAADWARYGRAAGLKRNQQMLDDTQPTLVIAFPGGRGTADMVRRARTAGILVVEIAGSKEDRVKPLYRLPRGL